MKGRQGQPTPLLVEEKPICRLAIADLVRAVTGAPSVRVAAGVHEALSLVQEAQPSLLLVDLFTIGFDFEALGRLVEAAGVPTVAIDDRPNPAFARRAQRAGARGYASKNYELPRFEAVVRAVVEGGSAFPDAVQVGGDAPGSRTQASLSPRQLEVLKCIAVGMSNQQIAEALGIKLGTVKLHMHAILRLTGTRNRTEAALIAGRFLAPAMYA